MRIGLSIDPALILLKARRGEKRFAFAAVNAINNAAKNLQKKVQEAAKDKLNIRKPFALRNVAVIKPFASVGAQRPFAEISVGQRDRLLLPELATPEVEERKPFTPGAKRVAVPIIEGQPRARFPGTLPRELYFKALRLKPWPRGTGGGRAVRPNELRAGGETIWRGAQRTYMIPSIGVFQRKGSRAGDTVPIYLFDEDVPLKDPLPFTEIMDRFGEEELTEELEKQIIKEIARGL